MNSRHLGIGMTSQRTRQRLVERLMEKGIQDLQVLDVIYRLPRHIFVDEALASRAYEDTALPIGLGQTISQPYTVARMTEILMQQPPSKVLEIGTGCGYQTAVLASLIPHVYSIERIERLQQKAREHLRELGVHNVQFRTGDGYLGWSRYAPFDAIILTAAPPELPEALLGQLADGGRLIAPVGDDRQQQLQMVVKRGESYEQTVGERVSFVPMLKGHDRR